MVIEYNPFNTYTIMKKMFEFAKIVAFVLGAIGGTGWSIYNHSYLIAAGCVVLALLALPEVKKSIDKLTA